MTLHGFWQIGTPKDWMFLMWSLYGIAIIGLCIYGDLYSRRRDFFCDPKDIAIFWIAGWITLYLMVIVACQIKP